MKLDFVALGATMMKVPLSKGAILLWTVPAGMRCWLYFGGGDFVADVTVITRTLRVILDTGAATKEIILLGGDITASQQKFFTLGVGAGSGVDYSVDLPTGGLPLGEGHRILIGETSVQAGDAWQIDLLMYYAYLE